MCVCVCVCVCVRQNILFYLYIMYKCVLTQLAGTVEYTNCISAEG